MKFLLGSSYFTGGNPDRIAFSRHWAENMEHMDIRPSRTVIICEGGSFDIMTPYHCDLIHLEGDLGHIGAHLNGSKKHDFTGWSASMCALAMLAYIDEADFLYKESDCLAFGPWVSRMYQDLGDGMIVFGAAHKGPPWQPCSQSLFLVRHAFIPLFVSLYLALGPDGKQGNMGEHKFVNIASRMKGQDRRLSFGVDRERPIPWNDDVFYFQQPAAADLEEARRRKLIS